MGVERDLYTKRSSFVLGFHGCSKDTFEAVIHRNEPMKMSKNEYDWLGHGIYFWENSLYRADEWAKTHYGEDGAVIGAIIDLGNCLDIMDMKNVSVFTFGYDYLVSKYDSIGKKLPDNRNIGENTDLLIRNLDCLVIETIHECSKMYENIPEYDTVRGTFSEGEPMYPGAGFCKKTHTQICVVNPNCIKGYFVPREPADGYIIP